MLDLKWQIDPANVFIGGNLLNVKESPEPEAVLYENLHVGSWRRSKEQVVSWTILSGCLALAYFSIGQCFANGLLVLGGFFISFWNVLLPGEECLSCDFLPDSTRTCHKKYISKFHVIKKK